MSSCASQCMLDLLVIDTVFSSFFLLYYLLDDPLMFFVPFNPFAAFAIEGQVKEKSRWFSSLRDLTRKVKVRSKVHIQHINVREK